MLAKIGIGGLACLVGFGGFAIWFFARRKHRLIFRDEAVWLGAPTVFVVAGLVLSIFVFLFLRSLARAQNRRIGWKLKGQSSGLRRDVLGWEEVLYAVVSGTLLGTIGLGLRINCDLDLSSPQTYHPTILKLRTTGGGGSRGGQVYYHFKLEDWRKPGGTVEPTLNRALYLKHKDGDVLEITTKKGLLGYEWVVAAR